MKNQIVIFCTLISLSIFGQTFKKSFLGYDFLYYKDSYLKVDTSVISGFDASFYSNYESMKSSLFGSVLYPTEKYKFLSEKDSFADKVYLVENITNKKGDSPDVLSYYEKAVFLLRDTLTGELVYYLYDKNYEHNFPFLVSNINYNIEELCTRIEKTQDEFTDIISINTPMFEGVKLCPMILYKEINKGKASYFLSLNVNGQTLNVGKKGVIILLENGEKITLRAQDVDVDAQSDSWRYSAFIPLDQNMVKMLSKNKINKFRLFIYDEDVSSGFGEKFIHYVQCLIDKK